MMWKETESLDHQTYSITPIFSQIHLGADYVALVLSRVNNYENRHAIRETWASRKRSQAVKNGTVVVFFILSSPKFNSELEELAEEQRVFNDLIVTDVIESYRNLLLKVHVMLMFFQQHCSGVKYLMKVDDDVAVVLDRMLNRWNEDKLSEHAVYCHLWNTYGPVRFPLSKWYVAPSTWPKESYPNYCDGPLYVVGRMAVRSLLENTFKHRPFHFEDVFFTGIVAESAGVRRINWSERMIMTDQRYYRAHEECGKVENSVVIAVHSLPSSMLLRRGYEEVVNFKCSLTK
ncbi:hypothetical protein Aduo_016118 [Ancylostoma duodenale]